MHPPSLRIPNMSITSITQMYEKKKILDISFIDKKGVHQFEVRNHHTEMEPDMRTRNESTFYFTSDRI